MAARTPRPRAMARARNVLPAPRSPESRTRSPGSSDRAIARPSLRVARRVPSSRTTDVTEARGGRTSRTAHGRTESSGRLGLDLVVVVLAPLGVVGLAAQAPDAGDVAEAHREPRVLARVFPVPRVEERHHQAAAEA